MLRAHVRPVLRRSALVLLLPLVAVGLPAPAQAVTTPNTITVDISSDTDAEDGHCSLREAMRNAVGNLRVHNTTGECGVGRSDVEDVVRWGFADPFSSVSSPLPTVTGSDPLRLAGEPGISALNPIITGGDATSLITVDGGALTLEKITLAHALGGTGSALNLVSGSAHLVLSNIAANTGSGQGGVMHGAAGTTITADSTTFVNNTVSGADGSVLHSSGTLAITHGVLTLTQAGGAAGAGTISASGATVTLTDVELSDNAGTGIGLADGTTATLTRVDLVRNVTPGSCGGLDSLESNLTWTGGEVFGNTAGADGGAICLSSATGAGSSRISRVSVTNNHAPTGKGGGLLVRTDDVQLGNVTISENTAAEAAALQLDPVGMLPAGVLLANVTVADNLNEAFGGTAVVVVGAESALTTSNTIIGRNQPADIATLANATATHDHGIIGQDLGAVVAPLDLNGGKPMYLTHRLLATAGLALDKGLTATCQLPVVGSVDQRGFTRPVDTCDIGALERDLIVPSASGAALKVATSTAMSGSNVVGRVSWTGGDAGSGVRLFRIQRSINGGAWAEAGTTQALSFAHTLAPGKSYRFRVRAEDYDGNVSPWSTTSSYGVKVVQQNSASVTWSGTWSSTSSTALSGGSARWSSKAGATATLTATGRGFALVSTKAPNRGKAKIYVDGVLRATIDLASSATTYKAQVWSTTFLTSKKRTVKVVVLGTSGRPRVDVDAFAVLT